MPSRISEVAEEDSEVSSVAASSRATAAGTAETEVSFRALAHIDDDRAEGVEGETGGGYQADFPDMPEGGEGHGGGGGGGEYTVDFLDPSQRSEGAERDGRGNYVADLSDPPERGGGGHGDASHGAPGFEVAPPANDGGILSIGSGDFPALNNNNGGANASSVPPNGQPPRSPVPTTRAGACSTPRGTPMARGGQRRAGTADAEGARDGEPYVGTLTPSRRGLRPPPPQEVAEGVPVPSPRTRGVTHTGSAGSYEVYMEDDRDNR